MLFFNGSDMGWGFFSGVFFFCKIRILCMIFFVVWKGFLGLKLIRIEFFGILLVLFYELILNLELGGCVS